jgi:hypothetical protein
MQVVAITGPRECALERRPVELADFDPPDDLVERLRAAVT